MSAKPGWYPNPQDESGEIYFDGATWTGEKRSKQDVESVAHSEKQFSFSLPIPSKYLQRNRIVAALSILMIAILGVTVLNVQLDKQARNKAAIERAERAKIELEARLALERIKNDVTWVPKGYSPWSEDKSIAFKWVNGAGNDCYSCTYWTADVVAKNGCTNGVYAEMNIKKGGIVISYTNDSLSYLEPYQTGRLSFETYEKGSLQGSLTELNCR